MANMTLTGMAAQFGDGTTVSVYPALARNRSGGKPSGTAVTTAAVSGDSLALTGLTADTPYIAYATGKAVRFFRISAFVAAVKWRDRVKARRVAIGTTLPGAP